MKYQFAIKGPAVAKERPRFGKYGNVYTPKKTRHYETQVGQEAVAAGVKVTVGPVRMAIVAYFGVKKSWPMHKRVALIEQGWAHDAAKDADNIAKAIKDGLNGVAYADDKQVVDLHIVKRWAWQDGVAVELEALS